MKLVIASIALISVLTFAAALLVQLLPAGEPVCEEVIVLATGGCDGAGVCGAVVANKQGQIKKTKVPYPVNGVVECIE